MLAILEHLKEGVENVVDLEMAILKAGYGASSGTINWEYGKIKRGREASRREEEAIKEGRRRLSKYLWKLKNDGLIRGAKKGQLNLTKKGRETLENFQESYEKIASERLVIVSFDIPESLRRGRGILREKLKLLGFQMVHQSTWFGKSKVPPEFLSELERIGVLKYVKIFEVTKGGTLIAEGV